MKLISGWNAITLQPGKCTRKLRGNLIILSTTVLSFFDVAWTAQYTVAWNVTRFWYEYVITKGVMKNTF